MIDRLRVLQGKGQPIRTDGPKSHLINKIGTPTMGGLMILAGIIVTALLWANLRNGYVWIVLMVTLGFGAIGFYDDYLKVTKQDHPASRAFSRLAVEGDHCVDRMFCHRQHRAPAARHHAGVSVLQGTHGRSRLVLPGVRLPSSSSEQATP